MHGGVKKESSFFPSSVTSVPSVVKSRKVIIPATGMEKNGT